MMSKNILPDWRILVTCVTLDDRSKLQKLVGDLGAHWLAAAPSPKDPPHLIITRNVAAPKFRAVVRSNAQVPCVLPEWLYTTAREGRCLGFDAYRVRPFQGLVVCMSGLSANRKSELTKMVEGNGGSCQAHLDKRCTHLVAIATNSAKYRCFGKLGGWC